jgi:hypothetical protein
MSSSGVSIATLAGASRMPARGMASRSSLCYPRDMERTSLEFAATRWWSL